MRRAATWAWLLWGWGWFPAACGSGSPARADGAGVDAPAGDGAPDGPADAPPGDGGTVRVGPLHELPLLAPWDPSRPFNHSAETSIAVRGGHVVVASIHMHFASADSFDTTGFHKRVGVVVSHDAGETFGAAVDPGVGDQTTDPVVRSAADGSFFLTTWDTMSNNAGVLARSLDHGDSWQVLVPSAAVGDHGSLAVDDAAQLVFVLGCSSYRFDGTPVASCSGGGGFPAYVDDLGAHVGAYQVERWDGTAAAPVAEGQALAAGSAADLYTQSCAGIGRAADGAQWIVRTVRESATQIVLRVRHLPGDEGTDLPLTAAAPSVFFPAAALDDRGRLHVIWYDTTGAQGVLKYARSLSSDLSQGLGAPIVIDPEALPGGGWYPSFDSAGGGRRVREYIEIAVDGNRAQLTWTHAPTAPSRVYATYVELAP